MELTSRRRLLALLVLVWLSLAAVAVVWGLVRSQDDIGDRAREALAAAGLDGVLLDVEGRDVIIVDAPDGSAGAIVAALEEVDGVRRVDFGGGRAAEDMTEPTVLDETLVAPTTAPTTTVPEATTSSAAPTTATTTTTVAEAPTEALVVATLDGGRFRLSGVVPDEETARALLAGANLAYAPFVESNLEVNPEVAPVPWLAGAPVGIGLLPMITEGTIRVEGDQVRLDGSSPNPQYLAAFEAALGGVFGLPVDASAVEITNLAPPLFRAFMSEGTLTLSGVLPSEETRQIIVGGARAAYGDAAVVDQTEVSDGLYVSFWMYTMPGVFELFRPFPEYEILVEDGVTSGALRGGASFAFDSAELTPEHQQLLGIGAAILSRDLSLGTAVEGHTDSVGRAAYNQRLSERRAQAAVDFLVGAGIAPERLRAVGYGETRPRASNDTAAGRTENRRLEFVFGPVAEVVGGP